VVIPHDVRVSLLAHAREALPNEACGVIVLDGERAVRYVPGRNAADSPYRYHLEVDPEVWFLEDDGYELAVFHSHPETPPRPSRTDVESIGLWEGRPYLILRADTGELSAWRIREGEISQEQLEE
jgi:proteasome lid subunit RPN8/RPN11